MPTANAKPVMLTRQSDGEIVVSVGNETAHLSWTQCQAAALFLQAAALRGFLPPLGKEPQMEISLEKF
jgi:hypothetical protein